MQQVDRISALRTQQAAVLNFCSPLSDEQWRTASNATGWSVGDVVAKMSSTCRLLLTADALRVVATRSIDQAHDRFVESRRLWERERVLEEFATWSGRAITLLDTVGRTPARSLPVPLGDIGQFPVGKLPSLLTFDWHTHLAFDMAPPIGQTIPPLGTLDISVVTEWMLSVLAQSGSAAATVSAPVELRLNGAIDGKWLITPGKKDRLSITQNSDTPDTSPATTIEGEATDFPSWGTARTSWRDHGLAITGDRGLAERFLDSVDI